MKFRKKPVVIEAFKFRVDYIPDWFQDKVSDNTITTTLDYCDIKTLEGTMRANEGDYIILGIAGEIYPCKPDIFEKSYEPVQPAARLILWEGEDMSREIKFRGKRVSNGEWVYGWLIKTKNHENKFYISDGDLYNDMGMMDGFVLVDPKSVGQYVGRKDKNGKEIYEGDIVKDDVTRKWVVQYQESLASFIFCYAKDVKQYQPFSRFLAAQKPLEIIGNITEMPGQHQPDGVPARIEENKSDALGSFNPSLLKHYGVKLKQVTVTEGWK